MPMIQIDLRRTTPERLQAIQAGIYAALRDTFEVPERDRFVVVHQHDADTFFYDPDYMDIARSNALVFIRIICSGTRGVTQKKALYARITELLVETAGLRAEDVFIVLIENTRADWSFGNGQAQYV